MSPEDTDVVEVALETLVALEKLRNHLEGRCSALQVLQARLDWESARRDFYTSYSSLCEEMDSFVTSKARWSPTVYAATDHHDTVLAPASDAATLASSSAAHPSSAPSRRAAKPPRSNFLLVEILGLEGQRLLSRIDDVRHGVAAKTGQNLDAVIAFLKVPDEFLDEQDRIDNLGEDLERKAIFLRLLISQWTQADSLFHTLMSLHKDARSLAHKAENASSERPTRDAVTTLQGQLSELQRRLQQLVDGTALERFLTQPDAMPGKVSFSSANLLPIPSDSDYTDQSEHTAAAQRSLNKELIATVKRVKQAFKAVSHLDRIQKELELITTLRVRVDKASQECQSRNDELQNAVFEHLLKSNSLATEDSPSHWNDLADKTCQEFSRMATHDATARMAALTSTKAAYEDALENEIASIEPIVLQLQEASSTCHSLRVPPKLFEAEVTDTLRLWQGKKQSLQERLTAVSSLLQILNCIKACRDSLGEHDRISKDAARAAIDRVGRAHWANQSAMSNDAARSASESYSLAAEDSFIAQQGCTQALEVSLNAATDALSNLKLLADQAKSHTMESILLHDFEPPFYTAKERGDQIMEVLSWAGRLQKQSSAIAGVRGDYHRLCDDFAALEDGLQRLKVDAGVDAPHESGNDNQWRDEDQHQAIDQQYEGLAKSLDTLIESTARFVSSQDTDVPMVGEPSASLQKLVIQSASPSYPCTGPILQSPDDMVRAASHDMCLDLARRETEITALLADSKHQRDAAAAKARQARAEQERIEQERLERERLDQARLEQEGAERERLERERLEQEQVTQNDVGRKDPAVVQAREDEVEETYKQEPEEPSAKRASNSLPSSPAVAPSIDDLQPSPEKPEISTMKTTDSSGTIIIDGGGENMADPQDFNPPDTALTNKRSFPSLVLTRAVQACEHELAKRDKSFKKTLNSATSRRLPKAAFLAELRHRRVDADQALKQRLDALRMVTSQHRVQETSLTYGDDGAQAELADRECHRMVTCISTLLSTFDAAIEAEGGSLPEIPQSAEKPKRRSIALPPSLSGGLEVPMQPRRRSAVEIPSSFSFPASLEPLSPTHLTKPIAPRLSERGDDSKADNLLSSAISALRRRLAPGEIEKQAFPVDGTQQAKMLLDLPTGSQTAGLPATHVHVEDDLAQLSREHPSHTKLGDIGDLCQKRKDAIERFTSLAAFGDKAAASEAAVSDLLQLLDQMTAAAFDQEMMSPSPSPSCPSTRSSTPQKLAGSRPSSRVQSQCRPSSTLRVNEDLQGLRLQIEEKVAELSALVDDAGTAATMVMDDVRVRDRVAQLNASFMDVSALSRETLEPTIPRSLSVLSSVTTESLLSRSSSPTLSDVAFRESSDNLASLAASSIPRTSRLPVTPRMASAPFNRPLASDPDRRRRTSSLVSMPPPSATAQRALARSKAAAAATSSSSLGPHLSSSSSTSSTSSPAHTTSHPVRQPAPRRRSSLTAPPQTPHPKTPLRARDALPSIEQSPSTPSTRTSSQIASSQSLSVLHTPKSLTRAPGSRLPLRSPSGQASSAMAVEATPRRRPNRYRANPKSKLDVAVGKIVNRLPVPVDIVHASKAPGARATDDWRDESGRYWVGNPDPKLCFCRILRSRTIMVRVGGGWQELTRYIVQHYNLAASVALGDASSSPTQSKMGSVDSQLRSSDSLPWINAASLRETTPGPVQMIPSGSAGGNSGKRFASGASGKSHDISSPILFSPSISPEAHFGTPTRRRVDSMRSPRIPRAETPTRSTYRGRIDSLGSVVDHQTTPVRTGDGSSQDEGVTFQLKAPVEVQTPNWKSASTLDGTATPSSAKTRGKGRVSSDVIPMRSATRPQRQQAQTNVAPSNKDEGGDDTFGQILPLFFRKENSPESARPARRSASGSAVVDGTASRRRVSQSGGRE